jgi:hypothetical protein
MVRTATSALFEPLYGDERDGDAPPITLKNFDIEALRYGARTLRAHLSRLSRADLEAELNAAAAFVATVNEKVQAGLALLEIQERENAAQELSKRQGELARRFRLQRPILAAAEYYQGQGKTHKETWEAIKKTPYITDNGETVVIEDGKMRVLPREGSRTRRSISISQWRQRYWTAAASKPGTADKNLASQPG